MPTREVTLHDETGHDYDAAFEWYLERSPQTAERFDEAVDRALAEIARAPYRWCRVPMGHDATCCVAFPICLSIYMSGTQRRSDLDSGGGAYEPTTRLLEGACVGAGYRASAAKKAGDFCSLVCAGGGQRSKAKREFVPAVDGPFPSYRNSDDFPLCCVLKVGRGVRDFSAEGDLFAFCS